MATLRLRNLVVFVLTIALAMPFLPPARSEEPDVSYLVTLAPGVDAGSALATHSGSWRALASGVVLVKAADTRGLEMDTRILSVEPDSRVRVASASWDRAGWDSASWESASWDRASWEGASWDSASWDRASWDRASWDASTTPPTLADPTWGYRAIRATVPENADPRAIVCLVDSGIDATHAQLARALWRDARGSVGIDLVRDDADPDDEAGHGTHLAGIIAASGGGPMRGVSDARLASAKIFDATGTGSTSDLIAALGWCTSIDADVILLALTEDTPTKALSRALQEAKKAGGVIVASAGNGGPCERCVSYPAREPHVVAVASLRPDLEPSSFSASGREIDLALPGSKILSTYPGNAWRVGSGTSQAAAYAAGAIAALIGDGLDADAAVKRLSHTATDLGQKGRDATTGHGIPDLQRAKGGME